MQAMELVTSDVINYGTKALSEGLVDRFATRDHWSILQLHPHSQRKETPIGDLPLHPSPSFFLSFFLFFVYGKNCGKKGHGNRVFIIPHSGIVDPSPRTPLCKEEKRRNWKAVAQGNLGLNVHVKLAGI